jgi:hypothetical protein
VIKQKPKTRIKVAANKISNENSLALDVVILREALSFALSRNFGSSNSRSALHERQLTEGSGNSANAREMAEEGRRNKRHEEQPLAQRLVPERVVLAQPRVEWLGRQHPAVTRHHSLIPGIYGALVGRDDG